MSSHHIVREDQEPALLIANADTISLSWIEQLLEWSPTVSVLEPALETVLSWGIKLDVVICAPEHVNEYVEMLHNQAPVKIISHHTSDSSINTAMMFLIAGKYRAVNVVGIAPSQVEEFTEHLDVVTFFEGKRWVYTRNGKFEKWVSRGTQFEFPENVKPIGGLDENGCASSDGIVKAEADFPFWVGEVLQ
ncbi:MAG: thiamine pyrophosphokinase [Cyclobacteriaceae bacterium]|nr:thiamine pyrophosphokinase [Cyclobacteriaceae bacterium]